MLTPSSEAMMLASVVLPRPGGPEKRTWSSASFRLRAPWMKTWRLSLTCCWPTYSSHRVGRRVCSTC